jgi:hypothetical protein
MIPETKQPIVTRALNKAFGVNEFEDIQLLTGGLSSARAFKIVVRKNPYLLKIMRTEVISDPKNEFACIQAAAEAGIAPRIWYASVEDRIMAELPNAPESPLPLAGVRVLDVSQVMAGPFCSMLLGDMGADVIKIEPPDGGDQTRRAMGFKLKGNDSLGFFNLNRNKRSLTLNLKSKPAREVFYRLVGTSDILVENYRPGVTQRLGIDYPTLAKINPRLIYASISGFGQTGPWSQRPGFDLIAQAMAGVMSITGQPDGPPTKSGVPVSDIGCALFALYGILAAYIGREKTGHGQYVDASLFEAAIAFSIWDISEYWGTGRVPTPLGTANRFSAPYQAVGGDNGTPWTKRVTSRTQMIIRLEGELRCLVVVDQDIADLRECRLVLHRANDLVQPVRGKESCADHALQFLNGSAAAYRVALGIYSLEATPSAWLVAQSNLGNTLLELGERTDGVWSCLVFRKQFALARNDARVRATHASPLQRRPPRVATRCGRRASRARSPPSACRPARRRRRTAARCSRARCSRAGPTAWACRAASSARASRPRRYSDRDSPAAPPSRGGLRRTMHP